MLRDRSELFEDGGLKIWFQNYTPPTYEQRFPPFVPYASALDLLFNHGPESGEIMRRGRGLLPFAPEQLRAESTECEAMS